MSGAGDNTVRVWDAASGDELLVLRGHEDWVGAAGFSPDGTRIVSGSGDGAVRVWDTASGEELLVLRGHEDWVGAAGFSPDGTRIVSGSGDGTVRVWDANSGAELMVLRGHEDWVEAAGFSPDGAHIVSGSGDGTVRVWFVGKNDAALVAVACASLPRDLSSEEIERFNIDPKADWRCAYRAHTLLPNPAAWAAIFPTETSPEVPLSASVILYFYYGDVHVDELLLDSFISHIRDREMVRIVITGHADKAEVPAEELSARRADSVAAALVRRGIPEGADNYSGSWVERLESSNFRSSQPTRFDCFHAALAPRYSRRGRGYVRIGVLDGSLNSRHERVGRMNVANLFVRAGRAHAERPALAWGRTCC